MAINLDKPLRWTATATDGSGNPDPEVREMLMNLQGNILKGHGRPEVSLIFFSIDPRKAVAAKQALHDIANQHITNAWQQLQDSRSFKLTGLGGGSFVHLALAQSGYVAIGMGNLHRGASEHFERGMRQQFSIDSLLDPDTSVWEDGFKQQIDGVVLVADLYRSATDGLAKELEAVLAGRGCTILKVQQGSGLDNAAGHGIEHFGYVDGRSQPLVLVEDIHAEATPAADRPEHWNPAFPLSTALVEDPGARGRNSYGSYFIFRKLEQDVRGFKRAEQLVADGLGLSGDERELAGAMLVGRFEDGTPVVESKSALGKANVPNDFNYDDDQTGSRCPFHAHIRKTNPRGAGGSPSTKFEDMTAEQRRELLDSERRHLFLRRGIPYQDVPRKVHPDELPDAATTEEFDQKVAALLPDRDVGLLFMAYNNQLANQFVFMQAAWANNSGFPFAQSGIHGLDPVIGQGPRTDGQQKLPIRWNAPRIGNKALDFSGFVKMKGGEYFFSPSLTFLKSL